MELDDTFAAIEIVVVVLEGDVPDTHAQFRGQVGEELECSRHGCGQACAREQEKSIACVVADAEGSLHVTSEEGGEI